MMLEIFALVVLALATLGVCSWWVGKPERDPDGNEYESMMRRELGRYDRR